MRIVNYIFVVLLFFSCENSDRKKIAHLVSYWQNREILFPADTSFISYNRQREERKVCLQKGEYMILNYVDSTGCMSCKLQLPEWLEFIYSVDSISHGTVPFVLVFQSKAKEDLIHFFKKSGFDYPVYIDEKHHFGQLNHFSSDMQLQTFLLNKYNKVIAVGNPIQNPQIKELYMNIIQGKTIDKEKKTIQTKIQIKESIISLGHFDWQEEQRVNFVLYNVGEHPLVINDVVTSCGCTSVGYSKKPVHLGDSILLQVTYKADNPEHFDKTITVHGNITPSPIYLKIVGDAE